MQKQWGWGNGTLKPVKVKEQALSNRTSHVCTPYNETNRAVCPRASSLWLQKGEERKTLHLKFQQSILFFYQKKMMCVQEDWRIRGYGIWGLKTVKSHDCPISSQEVAQTSWAFFLGAFGAPGAREVQFQPSAANCYHRNLKITHSLWHANSLLLIVTH